MTGDTKDDVEIVEDAVERDDDLCDRLSELDDEDDADFLRLLANGRDDESLPPKSRPAKAFVMIHPGDAVETSEGWSGPDGAAQLAIVREYSLRRQGQMAKEALSYFADKSAGRAVLHRGSSTMLEHGPWMVSRAFRKAIAAIEEEGDIAYGDDLDAAAEWIARYVVATGGKVLLSGAYSGKDGCVTEVADALRKLGVEVEVSAWTYDGDPKVDNDPEINRALPSTVSIRP